jgi:hypothetical protein
MNGIPWGGDPTVSGVPFSALTFPELLTEVFLGFGFVHSEYTRPTRRMSSRSQIGVGDCTAKASLVKYRFGAFGFGLNTENDFQALTSKAVYLRARRQRGVRVMTPDVVIPLRDPTEAE